jgi:hypothetical protein
MDPISASVGIGAIAGGANLGSGIVANRAAGSAMRSVRNAEAIQVGQLRDQAQFDQSVARRRSSRLAASLRTSLAAAGRSEDLSVLNAVDQVESDSATELRVIERNRDATVARVRSGTAAELQSLRARQQNPFLLAINSAMQGAQVGLAAFQGITAINGALASSSVPQAVRPIATPSRPPAFGVGE